MSYLTSVDLSILSYVQNFCQMDSLTVIFKQISYLGNNGLIWVILGLLLLAIKRTRMIGLLILCALIVMLGINDVILKNAVQRIRPFIVDPTVKNLVSAHGYSFPSGHTAAAFAAAGVMWQTLPRWCGGLALCLAGLIGVSRIYLEVHYPSDVLGGALIGLGIAWMVVKLYRMAQNRLSWF